MCRQICVAFGAQQQQQFAEKPGVQAVYWAYFGNKAPPNGVLVSVMGAVPQFGSILAITPTIFTDWNIPNSLFPQEYVKCR